MVQFRYIGGVNDSIVVVINGKEITLQHFTFNYNEAWNPISADLFEDPRSANDNNILLLWNTISGTSSYENWQALSFSSVNGNFLGIYDKYGTFWNINDLRNNKVKTFDLVYSSSGNDINRLGELYGDIYYKYTESIDTINLMPLDMIRII